MSLTGFCAFVVPVVHPLTLCFSADIELCFNNFTMFAISFRTVLSIVKSLDSEKYKSLAPRLYIHKSGVCEARVKPRNAYAVSHPSAPLSRLTGATTRCPLLVIDLPNLTPVVPTRARPNTGHLVISFVACPSAYRAALASSKNFSMVRVALSGYKNLQEAYQSRTHIFHTSHGRKSSVCFVSQFLPTFARFIVNVHVGSCFRPD